MKTRITKLFGIKYPIVLPGMSWISTPELVAAVSNAGGIGYLATGPLSPEQTRAAIRRTRELTDKPFGAGCTLLMPGAKENAEVMLDEKLPVINVSLGKCDWIAKRAHEYGGKVISTVVTEKHAVAAAKQGADALQVTGHEAAAHGGMVTSLVLIPAIARIVDIPIVAVGGFADGKGLVAAMALGADAVGMGTRLAITRESPLHDNTKKAQIESGIEDTMYSKRFDGIFCRVMKSPAAEKAIRSGMSLPRAAVTSMGIAKDLNINWFKLALGTMLRGPQIMIQLAHFASAFDKIKRVTEDGDLERGVQLSGQVQGLINDIPTVEEIIQRTIAEAKKVQAELKKTLS